MLPKQLASSGVSEPSNIAGLHLAGRRIGLIWDKFTPAGHGKQARVARGRAETV